MQTQRKCKYTDSEDEMKVWMQFEFEFIENVNVFFV